MTPSDDSEQIKCFICELKIPLGNTVYITKKKLAPEVLSHIREIEHIRRREEIERCIKEVPEGGISLLQHWSQYLDDNSTQYR